MNTLLLIDFSNMFARFFHMDYEPALQYSPEAYDRPKLRATMLYALCNLVVQFSPKKVVIALDSKPYWRTGMYPYYKENRKHSYNLDVFHAVEASIEKDLREVTKHFAWLAVPGMEADDIVAVLSDECESSSRFDDVVIYGSDGDFAQLDSLSKVRRFNPYKKQFVEKLGDPAVELLVKIVSGDAGDNIPPVMKGIGPKKALKIINEGKLEEWLDNNPGFRDRFVLNSKLIDFSFIPGEGREAIMETLDGAELDSRCCMKSLRSYMAKSEIPEGSLGVIASKFNGDWSM
jgi:5'-3' exonuclease